MKEKKQLEKSFRSHNNSQIDNNNDPNSFSENIPFTNNKVKNNNYIKNHNNNYSYPNNNYNSRNQGNIIGNFRLNNQNNRNNQNSYRINNNINLNNNISNMVQRNSIQPSVNEINYELLDQIGYISYFITEEPKIGLQNIGATCYMNATLQCLARSVNLANYFLDPRNKQLIFSNSNSLSPKKLLPAFYEVIQNLWIANSSNNSRTNQRSFAPNNFKKILSELNPLFKGIAACDAKDLILFILQRLHQELTPINSNNNINDYEPDSRNRNAALSSFLSEFNSTNKTIISSLFHGITETLTECLNCKQIQINQRNYGFSSPAQITQICYNYQIFNFLVFPLEEIRKWVNSNTGNCYNNMVSIYECFLYQEKMETMTGNNSMFCSYCRQNSNTNYICRIFRPPKYLILILNRGKGNQFNVKINFEELINIGNFVQEKSRNDEKVLYRLFGVVTHIGSSSMSGHFIAFCKSSIDNLWYSYNDSFVNPVTDFYKNIHEYGCPYVLFYEKVQ